MVEGLARLFLAVPLSDDARHAVSTLIADALPHGLPGRVVPPANWHLTLRFLGDVDPVRSDRVTAAIDEADLGGRFVVEWDALGAFPRPHKATVMWAGAGRGSEELGRLNDVVEDAVQLAGFEVEERPFRAHLTLSRIRPPRDVTDLIEAVQPLGVAMTVDRVVLYRSHLGRGGARYEEREVFALD